MAKFRDWLRTLRPASYRGVTFYVESDEIETGRRLEVHEFPHADAPYVEDLGRKANTITVNAYVVSDSADAEEKALRRACEAGGPALLSLPMERLQAHCEGCRRSFERDRQGYVAFDLMFVREGTGAGPFPIGFLSSIVSNLVAQLRSPVVTSFSSAYAGLRVPGFVSDAAVASVQAVAAIADELATNQTMRGSSASDVSRAALALYRDATTLARCGAVGHAITQTSFVASSETVSSEPLAGGLFDLARLVGESLVVVDAPGALEALLSFGLDVSTTPTTGWRAIADKNDLAISAAVRAGALAGFAKRISETRFTDRRDAIQARADVAELVDFELQRLDPARDYQVARLLSDIAGRTAEYLSRQVADLAPIVVVEAGRRMPSLWWAQRLYGSADRAEELSTRNGVKHSAFMPTSFEAKAR